MIDRSANVKMRHQLLAEMMGTAILTFSINSSSNFGLLAPMGVGMALFCNMSFLGGMSQSHYNPAVSVGFLVAEGRKNLGNNLIKFLLFFIAQLFGAILGVFLVFMCSWKDELKIVPNIVNLCPVIARKSQPDGVICDIAGFQGQVFLMELLTSFVFVNVCLANKYHWGSPEMFIEAVTNGASLFGMLTINLKVSSGYINPAFALIQSFFMKLVHNSYQATLLREQDGVTETLYMSLSPLWIYLLAPMFGGCLAGLWKHYNSYIISKM
jgi:glycerol uptake facilitator-like aquaporin